MDLKRTSVLHIACCASLIGQHNTCHINCVYIAFEPTIQPPQAKQTVYHAVGGVGSRTIQHTRWHHLVSILPLLTILGCYLIGWMSKELFTENCLTYLYDWSRYSWQLASYQHTHSPHTSNCPVCTSHCSVHSDCQLLLLALSPTQHHLPFSAHPPSQGYYIPNKFVTTQGEASVTMQ